MGRRAERRFRLHLHPHVPHAPLGQQRNTFCQRHGLIVGGMTFLGGIFHTLPFLIQDFHVAFIAAVIVGAMELATIAWIRNRYMDTPLLSAAFQVVVGGVLVFAVGIWIGSS